MICNNFVCAFSRSERGKILCDYDGLSDCNICSQMSCKRFKYLSCKHCGYDFDCFHQDRRYYFPAISPSFIEKVKQNELINAKRDIFVTSCNNYAHGKKTETTVKELYGKYNKQFPQLTKDYIREAVYKSILYYLKNQQGSEVLKNV